MEFDYGNYKDLKAAAANSSTKVGFFKLKNSGDQALVRFCIENIGDIEFATIHKPKYMTKWEGLSNNFAGISCLNELGNYGDSCPFCGAAAADHKVVSKATKQCYIKMLVSYKDPTTKAWLPAQPAVWERPISLSEEFVSKLEIYGSLKNNLFLVTKSGTGKETRYSIDSAPAQVFSPALIPEDFSVFNNFKASKHSYWVKTASDMQIYLATNAFPEVAPEETATETTTNVVEPSTAPQPVSNSPEPAVVNAPQVSNEVLAADPTPVGSASTNASNWF